MAPAVDAARRRRRRASGPAPSALAASIDLAPAPSARPAARSQFARGRVDGGRDDRGLLGVGVAAVLASAGSGSGSGILSTGRRRRRGRLRRRAAPSLRVLVSRAAERPDPLPASLAAFLGWTTWPRDAPTDRARRATPAERASSAAASASSSRVMSSSPCGSSSHYGAQRGPILAAGLVLPGALRGVRGALGRLLGGGLGDRGNPALRDALFDDHRRRCPGSSTPARAGRSDPDDLLRRDGAHLDRHHRPDRPARHRARLARPRARRRARHLRAAAPAAPTSCCSSSRTSASPLAFGARCCLSAALSVVSTGAPRRVFELLRDRRALAARPGRSGGHSASSSCSCSTRRCWRRCTGSCRASASRAARSCRARSSARSRSAC